MLNKIPAWRVIGASVMGISHRERSQPCQDNHAYGFTPQGDLLVAVADGAGSADRSQDGSRIAVQQAIATLHDQLACPEAGETPVLPSVLKQTVLAAFGAARAALVDDAEQEQIPLGFPSRRISRNGAKDATEKNRCALGGRCARKEWNLAQRREGRKGLSIWQRNSFIFMITRSAMCRLPCPEICAIIFKV